MRLQLPCLKSIGIQVLRRQWSFCIKWMFLKIEVLWCPFSPTSFRNCMGLNQLESKALQDPQLAARTRTSPCSWSSTHRPRTSTGNLFQLSIRIRIFSSFKLVLFMHLIIYIYIIYIYIFHIYIYYTFHLVFHFIHAFIIYITKFIFQFYPLQSGTGRKQLGFLAGTWRIPWSSPVICWGFPIMVPTMDIVGCSLIIQWINVNKYRRI